MVAHACGRAQSRANECPLERLTWGPRRTAARGSGQETVGVVRCPLGRPRCSGDCHDGHALVPSPAARARSSSACTATSGLLGARFPLCAQSARGRALSAGDGLGRVQSVRGIRAPLARARQTVSRALRRLVAKGGRERGCVPHAQRWGSNDRGVLRSDARRRRHRALGASALQPGVLFTRAFADRAHLPRDRARHRRISGRGVEHRLLSRPVRRHSVRRTS
jgi:hypothetical protein